MMDQQMDWKNYIHSDEKILLGKPVVKGDRIEALHKASQLL